MRGGNKFVIQGTCPPAATPELGPARLRASHPLHTRHTHVTFASRARATSSCSIWGVESTLAVIGTGGP
eukprot:1360998-Pyramimonas_sp.AAC.1